VANFYKNILEKLVRREQYTIFSFLLFLPCKLAFFFSELFFFSVLQ